jgi:class 3 adenylate cyclase
MSVGSSRTNGFLFADLRDYTRYVESYGDRAAAELLDAYRALVRAAVADFGGAEIKTEGDSFYVVFPSASSAVQCGLAILHAAAERGRERGTPIRVGIGVHAGETVETAEGYVGSVVNVAARVCSQARPGELLVTDTVRALTRTFLPVRFTDRRTRRLKGIAEPMVLYRVETLEEGAALAPPARRRLPGGLPSPSGIGPTARVAMLLLGLLLGGAASGYLIIAAQRPSGQTGSAGGASVAPSPVGEPAFPTDAEADLLSQLPGELRDSCVRTENQDERLGSVASVRCEPALTADADVVWYDRFASLQELSAAIAEVAQRRDLPRGTCGHDVSRAQGNWQVGSTHAGRLLCFQADGSTWIMWSYDAERIAARAVRMGDTQDDWIGMYQWWDQVRLFVR